MDHLTQRASFAGGVHARLVRSGFKKGEMTMKSQLSSEERLVLCVFVCLEEQGEGWQLGLIEDLSVSEAPDSLFVKVGM